MPDNILEAGFRCIFNSTMLDLIDANETLTVIWHAGEPLAAGIDFYERALYFLNKYNTKNIKVNMGVQTNATLINQDWCDFFKKHHFSVGVSVDGPEFIHDKYRKDWKNKGSFKKVMAGVDILRINNIPLSAICVLTHDSLAYPKEIYQFFKENNFKSLCFNIDEMECLNNNSTLKINKGTSYKNNIIEEYKEFMSIVFDMWNKDHREIWIREFSELISIIKIKKHFPSYYRPSDENLAFGIVVITKNGDITTFSPELAGGTPEEPEKFYIGNVLNIDSLDDISSNQNFLAQLQSIKRGVENCAQDCSYFGLCGGGSPSNKFYEKHTFEATETSFCILTKQALADVVIDKLNYHSK